MQTPALSSPLSSRAPLGAITIDSPLPPGAVIENLRVRGKEWRESALPQDLRKFKVVGLAMETEGSQFAMHWMGNFNPLYNPVCLGTVQPYGNGSRIRAGFKLDSKSLQFVGLYVFGTAILFFTGADLVKWILLGLMAIIVLNMAVRNRSAEPMRARLIQVLSEAAQKSTEPTI